MSATRKSAPHRGVEADQDKEAKKKTEEVEKEERLRPWNVDTISKVP